METLGYIRKIDELGRLVIPIEIRRKFDLDHPNAAVEFFLESDGILLKKYSQKCLFCGSSEDVVEFEKKRVCKNCIKKLYDSLKVD